MTQALATTFQPDQIELIKNTIAKDTTDDELSLFLMTCQRTGLDPFAKQIHAVKRWDRRANREIMSIQTGIDGYRLIAERTDKYCPGREPSFIYGDDGKLWSATAYVKKLAGGSWHEVAATAMYEEYLQTNKDGGPNAMWKKMPHTMLAKCAEALVLRRAFPAELSGLYTTDEMGQAENDAPPAPAYQEPAPRRLPAPQAPASKRPQMLQRIADLTDEATAWELDTAPPKLLNDMTDAELIAHGKYLAAAIKDAADRHEQIANEADSAHEEAAEYTVEEEAAL